MIDKLRSNSKEKNSGAFKRAKAALAFTAIMGTGVACAPAEGASANSQTTEVVETSEHTHTPAEEIRERIIDGELLRVYNGMLIIQEKNGEATKVNYPILLAPATMHQDPTKYPNNYVYFSLEQDQNGDPVVEQITFDDRTMTTEAEHPIDPKYEEFADSPYVNGVVEDADGDGEYKLTVTAPDDYQGIDDDIVVGKKSTLEAHD